MKLKNAHIYAHGLRSLFRSNNSSVYICCLKSHSRFSSFFTCSSGDASLQKYILKISDKNDIKNEALILEELAAEPHIAKIAKYNGSPLYASDSLVLEYYEGGDLFEYYSHRGYPFEERIVREIGRQVLAAIRECHKHNIVHVDIKLENIVMTHPDSISELKLIDFGGAMRVDPRSKITVDIEKTPLHISMPYVPPEVYGHNIITQSDMFFIDYWEFGVLLYLLLTFRFPFKIGKYANIIWPANNSTSKEMKTLVENLLKKNPSDRLNLDEETAFDSVFHSALSGM